MTIAVAGPYSADTEAQRQQNLDRMNAVADRLLEMGHVPLIGVNAALPVVNKATNIDTYKAIMDISMAVIANCDALLLIEESPGANRERDYIISKGRMVYTDISQVPVM